MNENNSSLNQEVAIRFMLAYLRKRLTHKLQQCRQVKCLSGVLMRVTDG